MTSPTPPPEGPGKNKPIQPKQAPSEPSKKTAPHKKGEPGSFEAMFKNVKFTPQQKKIFFETLMKQAAETIKSSFKHLVDQMRRNRNDG